MAGQITGQVTVTTAGTAVQGPDLNVQSYVLFTAHHDNTDTAWVGNDGAGDVSATTGFPLRIVSASANTISLWVNNLKDVWFDVDVSGEVVCYAVQAGPR